MDGVMTRRLLLALALAVLAGCSSNSPTTPGGGGGPTQGDNDDGGGGPAPETASVIVGNDFFRSGQDGSSNPARVTVAVGGTVTWTWTNTGSIPHSVESLGSPGFTSSEIQSGNQSTYRVTFTEPGTYQYDCAVHGRAMTGTIVVR
jgi:plastocyanin